MILMQLIQWTKKCKPIYVVWEYQMYMNCGKNERAVMLHAMWSENLMLMYDGWSMWDLYDVFEICMINDLLCIMYYMFDFVLINKIKKVKKK